MDFLGDLGGVTEVLMIMLGSFLYPISEFSFILAATKKLFYARTASEDLLSESDSVENRKKIIKKQTRAIRPEMRMHKEARLSAIDKVKLYLY